jgi:hypothetical protein
MVLISGGSAMTRNIVATGAIAVAAALGACADNGDEVLLILNNAVPGEECVLSGDEEGVFRSAGLLDTAGGVGYQLTPLVKNTATSETATEAQRTVFITGARVDLRFPDAALFDDEELQNLADSGLTRFEVPQAGAISPNGSTAPFAFDIMQPPLVAALSDELDGMDDRILVLADVRMRGTMGGGTIESQTFTFPITVCEGCNIFNLGPCAMVGDIEPRVSNPCNPFQDGPTDCCTVAEGLVCPAVSTGS